MKCTYCGGEMDLLSDWDKTQEEGFCSKLHRKDHEKQLIKEGKIPGIIQVGAVGVAVDSMVRDTKGEHIYFPKVGSHYDRALQRTFHSKKEKANYMKKNNLVMDGSSDQHRRPIEAGDHRFERIR